MGESQSLSNPVPHRVLIEEESDSEEEQQQQDQEESKVLSKDGAILTETPAGVAGTLNNVNVCSHIRYAHPNPYTAC